MPGMDDVAQAITTADNGLDNAGVSNRKIDQNLSAFLAKMMAKSADDKDFKIHRNWFGFGSKFKAGPDLVDLAAAIVRGLPPQQGVTNRNWNPMLYNVLGPMEVKNAIAMARQNGFGER